MKVYVLIKCEEIPVWEDSYCDCCGPEENTYNGDPTVIGVYSTLDTLENKLKQLGFDKEGIEDINRDKWNSLGGDFYYLEESELM